MDGWMGGWTNERMNERMDEWVDGNHGLGLSSQASPAGWVYGWMILIQYLIILYSFGGGSPFFFNNKTMLGVVFNPHGMVFVCLGLSHRDFILFILFIIPS